MYERDQGSLASIGLRECEILDMFLQCKRQLFWPQIATDGLEYAKYTTSGFDEAEITSDLTLEKPIKCVDDTISWVKRGLRILKMSDSFQDAASIPTLD